MIFDLSRLPLNSIFVLDSALPLHLRLSGHRQRNHPAPDLDPVLDSAVLVHPALDRPALVSDREVDSDPVGVREERPFRKIKDHSGPSDIPMTLPPQFDMDKQAEEDEESGE